MAEGRLPWFFKGWTRVKAEPIMPLSGVEKRKDKRPLKEVPWYSPRARARGIVLIREQDRNQVPSHQGGKDD